jgi:valacyclovir hydrolase
MAWFEDSGARIYYEEEGRGAPVLFLPGWSESIDEFAALRTAVAANHRVIAADLPGSGKSGPQPRQYASSYYLDDADLFAAFLAATGASPAHVLGFSDGGEVALAMAVRHPRALRSVVAWGAAGQVVTPPEMMDAFYNVVDAPPGPFEEFSAALKSAYGEANARAMVRSAVTAWRDIAANGRDISRTGAPGIASPVLLISGEHDFFAPPDVVTELAGAIAGAQSHIVAGAGHVLHEDHGDWLTATIVDWLSRHEQGFPPSNLAASPSQ